MHACVEVLKQGPEVKLNCTMLEKVNVTEIEDLLGRVHKSMVAKKRCNCIESAGAPSEVHPVHRQFPSLSCSCRYSFHHHRRCYCFRGCLRVFQDSRLHPVLQDPSFILAVVHHIRRQRQLALPGRQVSRVRNKQDGGYENTFVTPATKLRRVYQCRTSPRVHK